LRTELDAATNCVAELRKRQRQQIIEKLTNDSGSN